MDREDLLTKYNTENKFSDDRISNLLYEAEAEIAELKEDVAFWEKENKDYQIVEEKLMAENAELKEALQQIEKMDRARMYKSCPDCDFPNYCSRENGCESMRYSQIGKVANTTLEGNSDEKPQL